MEFYTNNQVQPHPVFGKPKGLVTADDGANRFSSEIKGKTILITGCGLASLGQHIAWVIAHHEPKLLILCGRSDVRLRLLKNTIQQRNPSCNVRHEVFDLGNLDQVRQAAQRINADTAVDAIICNAGIMLHPLRKTADGIESHLGVTIGHFVLVNELLPKMIANGGGRVVTTSSGAYMYSALRHQDPNYEDKPEEYVPVMAYASAKTADILLPAALARRYGSKGIVATSVDTGGGCSQTSLGSHLIDEELEPYIGVPTRTVGEASASQMLGAFDPALKDHNGSLLVFAGPTDTQVEWAKGEENEKLFWELSEKLAKQTFE